jgi:hypothetical protein
MLVSTIEAASYFRTSGPLRLISFKLEVMLSHVAWGRS